MEGNQLGKKPMISAEKCCKIIGLFRAIHPSAEIRLAAGRELYLGDLQPMALMAANSVFMDGYLNVNGSSIHDTIHMIELGAVLLLYLAWVRRRYGGSPAP